MRRPLLFVVLIALLLPVNVGADEDTTTGTLVWHAEAGGNQVMTVRELRDADGGVSYTVWVDRDKIYQDYQLTSIGMNGRIVLIHVREIRPDQAAKDAAKISGMRNPDTMFRAPRVVFGRMLADNGIDVYIEVRQCGVNYLAVITRVLPLPPGEMPKTTEM
jgi:hypothetical protein